MTILSTITAHHHYNIPQLHIDWSGSFSSDYSIIKTTTNNILSTIILTIIFPNCTLIFIRELLFQSLSDQLLAAYSDSTPFPFGSVICLDIIMIVMMAMMCNEWTQVIGQEIFQSGVIPSDTDFRVFRDFAGNLFSSLLYHSITSTHLIFFGVSRSIKS